MEELHDDDEMEMSDDDRDSSVKSGGHTPAAKRVKLDNDSLKVRTESANYIHRMVAKSLSFFHCDYCSIILFCQYNVFVNEEG